MTGWLETLSDAWDELVRIPPVARQFRTRLISTDVSLDILAAIRATDDAPCLMLQTAPAPDALFELGGMRLGTVSDNLGLFLVLSLEDSSKRDLFSTICADVIAAASAPNSSDSLDQFLARLDAWRQFLRDRRDGFSRSETIGLIGELLVLEQVLAVDPHHLDTWRSPNDGLHDFQIDGHALEVKTSLGPASTITISSLDQLDSAGLNRLDLLHVRLIENPDGRSLKDILTAIGDILPHDSFRRAFYNALLRRGLMPDDLTARITPKVQQRAIEAYLVSDTFPRLLRSTVPAPVADATYRLEIRAISDHAEELATVLDAFIEGDHT